MSSRAVGKVDATSGITARAGSPMTGLSHIQLLVSDMRRSVEWYTAALGMEHYAGDPDIGYVALRHQMAKVVIVLTPRPDVGEQGDPHRRAAEGTSSATKGPLDHMAFAVPDGDALRDWAAHLTEAGVEHPGIVLENGNPSLQLRDPDDIAIELVAPGPPAT